MDGRSSELLGPDSHKPGLSNFSTSALSWACANFSKGAESYLPLFHVVRAFFVPSNVIRPLLLNPFGRLEASLKCSSLDCMNGGAVEVSLGKGCEFHVCLWGGPLIKLALQYHSHSPCWWKQGVNGSALLQSCR